MRAERFCVGQGGDGDKTYTISAVAGMSHDVRSSLTTEWVSSVVRSFFRPLRKLNQQKPGQKVMFWTNNVRQYGQKGLTAASYWNIRTSSPSTKYSTIVTGHVVVAASRREIT